MSKRIGIRRSIVGLPSQSYTAKHGIIFISSLLLLLSPAGAQSGPNGTGPDPYAYQKFTPTMIIVVVVLVAALFLMAFFSVYVRQRSETSQTGPNLGRPLGGIGASLRRRAAAKGLDPAVIETFPTFEYSAVKGLKIGKGDALECAVCLNEFEDEDTLRLIPKCDHVFHPECIDTWLVSHVTCPVCRANLVPQPGQTDEFPEPVGNQIPENDDVAIQVLEDLEVVESVIAVPPQVVDRNRPQRSWSMKPRFLGKFGRSYTTGHLVVQPGENMDRFTLRLPMDVRKQVMSRTLNRTASCAVVLLPTEASSRRGYRTGVGTRSSKRLDRNVKSDRWVFSKAPPFLTRSSSLRSPNVIAAVGEGSSKRIKTAVKFPSFNCLEPRGDDEAVLVSADSARHPI